MFPPGGGARNSRSDRGVQLRQKHILGTARGQKHILGMARGQKHSLGMARGSKHTLGDVKKPLKCPWRPKSPHYKPLKSPYNFKFIFSNCYCLLSNLLLYITITREYSQENNKHTTPGWCVFWARSQVAILA